MPLSYPFSGFVRQIRGNLCRAAIVLGMTAVMLSTGCAQGEMAPASPTATYVPPPTATPVPTATPFPPFRSAPPAEISVKGTTLVYNGIINRESYSRFRWVTAENDAVIDTIQITSRGGDTSVGKKMGRWIHDRNINVIVDNFCISSCANYIFTAGRNKVIREDSIVGWHGSEHQDEYIARAKGVTLEERLKQVFDDIEWPEAQQDAVVLGNTFEEFKSDWMERSEDERKFLEKVAVSVDVMVYGLSPDRYDEYLDGQYSFWTFSIEDMAKFGIDNVSYEGSGEYPSERSMEKYGTFLVFQVAE